MKKISNLAGIVAAAALLCGISACDNSETITMTSAKIEMVGDPIVTDKAAIFQWKDSVANGEILITRQAPGEEEVTISDEWTGWIHNGFVDRVTNKNLLQAGVEYTYRFYNESGVSSARATESTLEMKYGCVERKVKFESIAAPRTKLAPITEEQVKIVKSDLNDKNYESYVSIYVDEKEARTWMTISDKTEDRTYDELWDNEIGGVERFKYDPSHTYEIWVGKWWPGSEDDDERLYDNSDTGIKFDLGATKSKFSFDVWGDSFKAIWSGIKGSTYEVSFEAFDNQGNTVTLKKSKLAADDIKKDVFDTYEVTGKISDLIDTAKTIKMILKETTADKTVYESESSEREILASLTKYTEVDRLYVSYNSILNEEKNEYEEKAFVTLSGANLPDTAKLYRKHEGEVRYTEVTVGLKKDASGNLVAIVPCEGYYTNYDFKAVVTVDNKNWYDWEEGKTEEVVEQYRW